MTDDKPIPTPYPVLPRPDDQPLNSRPMPKGVRPGRIAARGLFPRHRDDNEGGGYAD